VAVSGAYAYVADEGDGLRIIDISNPAAPTESGFFDTGGSALGVAVSGAYAYVADGGDGLCIIQNNLLVGIEENLSPNAQNFVLEQNYPNPFNPVTKITYTLKEASDVKLAIYDITGREVSTLVSQRQNLGEYSVTFNAYDFASGVYFYKLKAGSFEQSRKMLLVK
ncbi:MAG: T9SS type A sorting domain-containing protein, partial [Calditrichaceae bacterium]